MKKLLSRIDRPVISERDFWLDLRHNGGQGVSIAAGCPVLTPIAGVLLYYRPTKCLQGWETLISLKQGPVILSRVKVHRILSEFGYGLLVSVFSFSAPCSGF